MDDEDLAIQELTAQVAPYIVGAKKVSVRVIALRRALSRLSAAADRERVLVEALRELLETVDAQYRCGIRWDPETVARARALTQEPSDD